MSIILLTLAFIAAGASGFIVTATPANAEGARYIAQLWPKFALGAVALGAAGVAAFLLDRRR